MKGKSNDRFGIPQRTCFWFVDENGDPITKIWIWHSLVFYKNYTKTCLKRAFGKKRIVFLSDVQRFLYTRSIPESRNMRDWELKGYGLPGDAPHWEIAKALEGRTMSDEYSIRFF